MRLTLRTLLAYLDDILDPADARELGKKIEESEFASGLVHRIRSVTRKLRLGAPKLAGKGMGLDANTVAEYLDNTLPQDRVPDFEKVCLESDVQLAEVASCHQILTLVLGEPADVDPALRERIRSLQAELEGATLAERARESKRGVPPEPTPPSRDEYSADWGRAPDVPVTAASATRAMETGRSIRLMPVLGTLVVAFLLALVALMASGPLNHQHPILGRFFADASPAGERNPARAATSPAEQSPQTSDNADVAVAADSSDQRGSSTPKLTNNLASSAQPPGSLGDRPAAASSDAGSVPPPPAPPEVAPDAAKAVDSQPAASAPASEAPTAMNDPLLARSKLPPDGKVAEEPAPPEPLAQYTSDRHVLARFDVETETWLRLATNDPLTADTRLVALPTYRPQILFSSGVQLMAVGPAEVRLTAADADGVPGIIVQYGRLTVMPVSQPKSRVNIQFGTRQSRVTFDDLDATLVLDAWRYLPAGVDPQSRAANWVMDVFTPAGRLSWHDQGAAAPTTLEPGQLATMVDTGAPTFKPLPQPPDWLDVRNEPLINQAASKQLEPLLDPTRPLTVSLGEQVNNRLVEVRTLAIRSLSLFDEFDPSVSAINARELRYFWKDLVESMRAAEARSPETAKQMHAAFGRLRGEEGAQLDRLLWGFSPEQLVAGGAQELVEALSRPSTDVRVLAYLNLNEITGKTNNFQPDREPRSQKRSIMSWERDLQQREINHKTPPTEPPGLTTSPKEGEPPDGSSNVP
jgi:hypothetical protein